MGKSSAAIALLQKAARENPESYELKQSLANLYITLSADAAGEEKQEYLQQAAMVSENIITDCTQRELVMKSEHSLISVYYQLGWRKKLNDLLSRRSYMDVEVMSMPLLEIAKGNDRIFAAQSAIYEFCGALLQAINSLTDEYIPGEALAHIQMPGEKEWRFSPQEERILLETGILIFDRIFGSDYKGLMLYIPWRLALKLCRNHLKAADPDQAIDALRLAVSYACEADANADSYNAGIQFRTLVRGMSESEDEHTPVKKASFKALALLEPISKNLILSPFSSTPALCFLNSFNYGVPFSCGGTWLCSETLRELSDNIYSPIRCEPSVQELIVKLHSKINSVQNT
ncbi:MAG: hypothetical protein PUB32_04015 [Clostridiales bacterium]|nr:hypothetical protein [Clostridiales bacterium]